MRLIDGDALKEPLELQRASYARIGATERAEAYANCLWEIAQAPTIGGWISVKDKKRPHICSLVLAVWENAYGFQKVRMSEYDKYKGEEIWSDRPDGYHVTHWMPLPEPPEEKVNE